MNRPPRNYHPQCTVSQIGRVKTQRPGDRRGGFQVLISTRRQRRLAALRGAAAHQVTRTNASATIDMDIFDVPSTRSTKQIGTSETRPPWSRTWRTISIWKP